MKKIRWGILSTAKIAREHVMPAIVTSHFGELTAVASRNLESAQALALRCNIPTAHGSYEALLADPNIDAIYNPLPNHLHVPWSLKALAAGKHVLVEKPIGLNVADLTPLLDCVAEHPSLKVMEAFMYRFHPQWVKIHDLCNNDSIGQIRSIQSTFNYNNRDLDNIRNDTSMGGGALMDIGCYNISLSRYLFNAEPKRVMAQMRKIPGYEVDCITSAMLEFSEGTSVFTCSTKTEPAQWAQAQGESGSIRIHTPFNPIKDKATELTLTQDGTSQCIPIAPADHYQIMVDAFAQAILNDTPVPTPLTDALANMKIIDALVESAKTNQWIEIN